jgi:hypothetical protein
VKASVIFKYKKNKYQFHVPRYILCKNSVIESFMNICSIQEPGECSECSDYTTGWMIQGFIPSIGKRFFSTLKHPGWPLGPPSLVFHGYWGLCHWG